MKHITLISILTILLSFGSNSFAQTSIDSIQSSTLDELVVQASNVNYKGNIITNVFTETDLKKAYNAGTLLGTAQGINYDRVTRQITYLGSSNIVILIDGLPKPLDYIISQNPKKYLKVEIKVNPVGQYAGYDAIVNLISKPKYEGYDFSANTWNHITPGCPYKEGDWFQMTHDEISFSYTRNNWTFEVFGKYNWERTGRNSDLTETYPLNGIIRKETPLLSGYPRYMDYSRNAYYYVTLGYQINKNHKISLQCNSDFTHESMFGNSLITTFNSGESNPVTYEENSNRKDKILSNYFAIYYQGLVKGWQLYANFSDYIVDYKLPSLIHNSDGSILDNSRDFDNNYFAGVMNASKSFYDDKFKLSLSDNFSFTNSSYKNHYNSAILSENHNFKNSIYAGFGYFPGNKISANISAGIINERVSDKSFSKIYTNPRIDAMISFQPSQKFIGRLNYTIKSNYSSVMDTQDYGYFSDWYIYTHGNTALKPALTHTLNLFTNIYGNLDFNAIYTFSSSGIATIYTPAFGLLPDNSYGNYAYATYENGRMHNLSLLADYRAEFGNHFTAMIEASINYKNFKYKDFSNKRWFPSGEVDFIYRGVQNTLMAILQYNLKSWQSVTPQQITYGMHDSINAMVQKLWFKNRFSTSLVYCIPLHIVSGNMTSKLISEPYAYTLNSNNQWRQNNRITVVLEYSFSGGQPIKENDKSMNIIK